MICDSRIHGLVLSVKTSQHLVYELHVLYNSARCLTIGDARWTLSYLIH